MVSKTVKVVNEQGMHMRPAGELAKAVKAHPDCEVTLNANGKTVKAKSPYADYVRLHKVRQRGGDRM